MTYDPNKVIDPRVTIRMLEERVVFKNRFATAWNDRVRFPSGAEGEYFRWRWNIEKGVTVLPFDGASALLIWAHRYGEPAPSWQAVTGFGDAGCTVEEDATRELWEECGLVATRLEPLCVVGRDLPNHVFLAHVPDLAVANADSAETTEAIGGYRKTPLSALLQPDFAALGVADAPTIIALTMLGLRAASGGA